MAYPVQASAPTPHTPGAPGPASGRLPGIPGVACPTTAVKEHLLAVPHEAPAPADDATLMARVGERRTEALHELYQRYFRRAYALALRILGDPGQAEDCVQDVFLKLWQRPALYDPTRGAFVHWFLAAVHNNAINQLRRRGRTQPLVTTATDPPAHERPLPEPADRPAGESSVEDSLGQAETQAVVRAALAELSVPQRAALELAYFGGMSQSEIAAHLQEPLGTIKTRMRTGLQRLRAALEARGWGKDVRFG